MASQIVTVNFKSIMEEVPSTLKEEIMYFQFGTVIKNMLLFHDHPEHQFIWDILGCLEEKLYHSSMEVYVDGGLSDSFYLINSGSISILNENGMPFYKYSKYEYFGHLELFCNCRR